MRQFDLAVPISARLVVGFLLTAIVVLLVCPQFTEVAQAKTIHVPSDSATIHAVIDGAANEDTVLVGPGTCALWGSLGDALCGA